MKSLVFLAIFALSFVRALPTAEPVPLPEPIPGHHGGGVSCNLKNGSVYHYEYDLTGTTLYNSCQPGSQGVFTKGISKYDSVYNVSPYVSVLAGRWVTAFG